jgi:4-carboxymuconolactone decarboxylase
MTRLPFLRRAQLDIHGAAVWDAVADPRGNAVVTADGGLAGPFNAWLHAPALGRSMVELVQTLRFGTSLERRLIELAIVVVAAHWKSEYEWWAHAAMARDHGVGARALDALRRGEVPHFDTPDEAVVYDFTRQLVATGVVSDEAYEQALTLLAPAGVVELVSVCGFYTLVSFTLNAFAVGLPSGAKAAWG